jgi:hypothetical protein
MAIILKVAVSMVGLFLICWHRLSIHRPTAQTGNEYFDWCVHHLNEAQGLPASDLE